MSTYKTAAVVIGTVAAIAAIVPAFAASAENPHGVIILNTNSEPVPVTSPPPPLWQGTPYVATRVRLSEGCETFDAVPAGKVLYLERAIASFNVAPGRGASPAVGITPLGGSGTEYVYIPVHPSAPVHHTFGVYDGYQGSVDVGLPTSDTPQACFFATSEDDVRGRMILTGYLVDAN